MVKLMLYFLDQVGRAYAGAAYYVRVTVQILRATVQRKIEAPLGWSEVNRAGERVVDHRDQSVFLRERNGCIEIAHLKHRIRHCLDVNGFCVWPQLALPRVRIIAVDEIELQPEPGEVPGEKIVS